MSRTKANKAASLESVKALAFRSLRRPFLLGLCFALIVGAGLLSTRAFPYFGERSSKPGASAVRTPQSAPILAGNSGRPWVNLGDGRSVNATYAGSAQDQLVLEPGRGKPVALASADFDRDGIADMVVGYASADRSVITLLRGNVDARFPNSPEAQARQRLNQFTDSPFLAAATVIESPQQPDFMAAGDFNNDGFADIVVASRRSNQLYVLAGNGKGAFDPPSWIDLPGPVTALAAGDVNRTDGLADLVLGVNATDGAKLLVFEGANGAINSPPETYSLNGMATSLAIGYLDSDSYSDIVVGTSRRLTVIHGRDRKLSVDASRRPPAPAVIENRSLAFTPNALVVGNYLIDPRTDGQDIGMLGDDGALYVVSPVGLKGNPDAVNGWAMKKLAAGPWPGAAMVTGARLSSLPVDSLVVSDVTNHQLQVVTDGSINGAAPTQWPALVNASLTVQGNVAAMAAGQLNVDAISDLVVLADDQIAPAFVPSVVAMTFTVTTTADSGAGSLRQAILDANSNPGADTISFAIGSGAQTIAPTSDLPAVTDPVTIDATTQPGFGGTPIIELNGTGMPSGIGFKVSGGSCIVRGLIINRCILVGIEFIQNGNDTLEGCYIGTNAAGTAALANLKGVNVFGISGCVVGGTTAAARNVISGNTQEGVEISSVTATGDMIQGNYIGTDATGAADLGNGGNGISVNSKNNTVGGTTAGAGNVISGNVQNGVRIFNDASITGNKLQGNIIGLNAAGSAAIANSQTGVFILGAPGNTVGGTAVGAGNTISGNGLAGVYILNTVTAGILVQGNTIGSVGLGNTAYGVLVDASPGNSIGGTATGAGNIISGNVGRGVVIANTTTNTISRNSIFSNTDLGIDLGNNGVTPNDLGDGDGGPNTQQNFPVLSQGIAAGGIVNIPGTLNSLPNTAYTVEFFANTTCDPTGNGEGEIFLGSVNVTTNASGNASFTTSFMVPVTPGQVATATATDPNGNTSEFSACVPICVFSIAPTTQNFTSAGGADTINVTATGGCTWTAVSNAAFITVTSGATGTGNGTVGYSVAVNPDHAARSGTITVANNTFTVTQDPAPCNFSILPTSQMFLAAGGTGTVAVTVANLCTWTAVSNDAFITVTSGASGSGNGTVGYSVAVKPDAGPRTGTMTIAGLTFTVTQSGADCVFSIMPTSQHFVVGGGTGTVNVTTPGGCFWNAVSNDAFITITSGASGTGSGAVGFSVAANPNPGNRSGTMTIAAQTFTVTQDGTNPCAFTLTPDHKAFAATGGSSSVAVTTDPTCTWTAVSNAAFITITGGASGTGSGVVTYSVTPSTNSSIRTGTMTIAGQTFTVTVAGTSCVTSISPLTQSFLAGGGTGFTTVTAAGNCSWSVLSVDSFITVTSGATGFGSQNVKYTVAANASPVARIGYIIVGSQVHTVSQAGTPCTFSILPTSQSVAFGGGTGSFNVTTQANCQWTAVSNAGFITVT